MNAAQSAGRTPAPHRNGRTAPARDAAADPVARNIEEIVKLGQRDRLAMTFSDRIADWMTAFSGSMVYVWLHVAWFGAWIVSNIGLFGLPKFDPFPFGLLTMIVSLEAIFLSTFVLISQNRQALQADRRQKVNMQIDILAEQEVTRLVRMVAEIQDHLGMESRRDPELRKMTQATHIDKLADALDEAEQKEQEIDPEGARGPRSAVDTQR